MSGLKHFTLEDAHRRLKQKETSAGEAALNIDPVDERKFLCYLIHLHTFHSHMHRFFFVFQFYKRFQSGLNGLTK